MIYRKYKSEDEARLREIHAQRGYSFEFPELSAPDIESVWVAEDDGRIVSVVIARKTVEVTALVDAKWSSPAWRLLALQELQERGAEELAQRGFTDMHSFVARDICGFGRRLRKSLGWIRSVSGDCFVRGTGYGKVRR